jgi:hypothetical protein
VPVMRIGQRPLSKSLGNARRPIGPRHRLCNEGDRIFDTPAMVALPRVHLPGFEVRQAAWVGHGPRMLKVVFPPRCARKHGEVDFA